MEHRIVARYGGSLPLLPGTGAAYRAFNAHNGALACARRAGSSGLPRTSPAHCAGCTPTMGLRPPLPAHCGACKGHMRRERAPGGVPRGRIHQAPTGCWTHVASDRIFVFSILTALIVTSDPGDPSPPTDPVSGHFDPSSRHLGHLWVKQFASTQNSHRKRKRQHRLATLHVRPNYLVVTVCGLGCARL